MRDFIVFRSSFGKTKVELESEDKIVAMEKELAANKDMAAAISAAGMWRINAADAGKPSSSMDPPPPPLVEGPSSSMDPSSSMGPSSSMDEGTIFISSELASYIDEKEKRTAKLIISLSKWLEYPPEKPKHFLRPFNMIINELGKAILLEHSDIPNDIATHIKHLTDHTRDKIEEVRAVSPKRLTKDPKHLEDVMTNIDSHWLEIWKIFEEYSQS